MKNKDLTNLILTKQKSISYSHGYPKMREGNDGDITIRTVTGRGIFLFCKINGKWFQTRLSRYRPTDIEGYEPIKLPIGKLPTKAGEITLRENVSGTGLFS